VGFESPQPQATDDKRDRHACTRRLGTCAARIMGRGEGDGSEVSAPYLTDKGRVRIQERAKTMPGTRREGNGRAVPQSGVWWSLSHSLTVHCQPVCGCGDLRYTLSEESGRVSREVGKGEELIEDRLERLV